MDRGSYVFTAPYWILIYVVQLDDQFLSYHRIREHRIKTRGENIVRILPDRPGVVRGGNDAGKSNSYICIQYNMSISSS